MSRLDERELERLTALSSLHLAVTGGDDALLAYALVLAFHERMGFTLRGTLDTADGCRVALLARDLV